MRKSKQRTVELVRLAPLHAHIGLLTSTLTDLVEVAVGGQQGVGSLRSDRGMPTTLADDRRRNSADATARSERRWPRRAERPESLTFR